VSLKHRWKNKVKKLESAIGKYHGEIVAISEDNEMLKTQQNGMMLELDNKCKEVAQLKVRFR
jgi:hypothetical protein